MSLPCFNIGGPGLSGGMPMSIPSNAPVYSTYTGNVIGYGNIPKGMMTDAPMGHHNHGKPFHVVEFVPGTNIFMAHQYRHQSFY